MSKTGLLIPIPVFTARTAKRLDRLIEKFQSRKSDKAFNPIIRLTKGLADRLPVSKLPEGQPWYVQGLSVVTRSIDDPNTDSILFTRSGEATIASISISLSSHAWVRTVSVADYARVLIESINLRAKTHADVALSLVTPDPRNTVFKYYERPNQQINLNYRSGVEESNPLRAVERLLALHRLLCEPAESVAQAANRVVNQAISRLSGWGDKPIDDLLMAVDQQASSDAKGRVLEELCGRLLGEIEGFEVSGRVKTETEEIDLLVLNASSHPIWSREKSLVLVECKNWSTKCGKNEFVILREKLQNRVQRCSLGILISWNGFAETFTKEQLRGSREDIVIIPLTGQDLRSACRTGDFAGLLQDRWREIVMA